MRSAPFFALIAVSLAVSAKEPAAAPAPSRSEQVLGRIDPARAFHAEQASAYGASNSFHTGSARTNSFYIQQKFLSKGYDTKAFATKNAWGGDFKFSTSEARTKTFETKAAPTKAAAVKEAHDAGKTAATREFIPGNRNANFKGRNQELFDKEGPAAQAKVGAGWRTTYGDGPIRLPAQETQSWSGNLKELSVDDVREILNKNK